jgi:hypothetical protein
MDLSEQWVVGFVDGEGCFFIGINKQPEMTTGYQVLPEFRIIQQKKDVQILYALKKFFQCGVVRKNHDDRFELRIRKFDCLVKIVEFFESHPLYTKKNVDFKKFAHIIRWMKEDQHLTKEGLIKIIEIASEMNRSEKIKAMQILAEIKKTKV